MQELNNKLIKIISKLKAPKGQKNTFGGYKYRSCEDILEAVKPLLEQENLRLKLSDEICEIGSRIYVKATATITDGENFESNTAMAREAEVKKGMDESQITGTASSYARKYALNGLLCIDDTRDADTNEYQKTVRKASTPTQPQPQPVQPEFALKSFQIASLKAKMNKLGYDQAKIAATIAKIDSKATFDRIILAFDDKLKSEGKK